MRILYVSFRINAADGSAVHGRAFVENATQLGHHVTVYPPMRQDVAEVRREAVKRKTLVHYLKKINWVTFKAYLRKIHRYVAELIDFTDGFIESVRTYGRLRKLIEDTKPDVIVFRPPLFQFAPLWACKRYGLPCVLEVNALRSIEATVLDKGKTVSFLTRWADEFAVERADYIVTVSTAVKKYVDRLKDPARSIVVPNGVDTAKFDSQRFNGDDIKRRLGLGGKTVLGYAGSYQHWHGVDGTVDVIERLARSGEKYHLLMIGNGGLYSHVERAVASRGLERYVTQIPQVSHDEMPRYLAAFDYALMTYPAMREFHGSPLKLFEYLSMGIVVIATNVGQIGEVITSGESGILVDLPTTDNFLAALHTVECDPQQIARIRAGARQLMIAEYSWRANAKQVVDACSRAVAARAL
jgi:glycosyltransferase involved in cell wall biosynthesis